MARKKKQPIFKYGIEITKPWSSEMYDHNEKVKELQKAQIIEAIDKLFAKNDEDTLSLVAKTICGYGFGMGFDIVDITEEAKSNLEHAQSHWMKSDVWPDLLELDLVDPISIDYIGLDR